MGLVRVTAPIKIVVTCHFQIAGQGLFDIDDTFRDFEDNNVINISGSYNFFGTPIESEWKIMPM